MNYRLTLYNGSTKLIHFDYPDQQSYANDLLWQAKDWAGRADSWELTRITP